MPRSLTSQYQASSSLVIPALERKEIGKGDFDNELWLSRLNQTLRWRQNYWNGDRNWNRAYDLFRGKHWRDMQEENPSSDQLRDRITVNEAQSAVLDIVPFLMIKHPLFVGTPVRQSKTASVKLQTQKLNYEYTRRDMNSQVKKSVYDAAICGHGICKDGYILEVDEAIKKTDGININYEDYIKESAPYIKRISPFFFLIDPLAPEANLETARWCAEIFLKTERDILANSRYNPKVQNKIKSGYYPLNFKNSQLGVHADDPTLNNLSKESDDPALPESRLCLLFEVWDWKYKKLRVFADGCPEPLLEKDWPYDYIDKFPFTKMDYIALPDELYGVGIPYQIEDQQLELNRNRTYAFEHRRRFSARKYEVLNNVTDPEFTKFANGEDGAMVRVQQIGSIVPIPDAPMPDDTQIVEGMIRSDIQRATGLDNLFKGGNLQSRTTSGEVQTRASIFRLKLEDRIDTVDKFVLRVANHVLQHIKGNFTQDEAIRLFGPSGEYWETLTPDMIKEDVDLDMETIAAPQIDPVQQMQMALNIWQTTLGAAQFIQAGVIQVDLNKLFGWVMDKMGVKDAAQFFMPATTPTAPLLEAPAPPDPNKVSNQQGQGNNVLPFPQQQSMNLEDIFQQRNEGNPTGTQIGAAV